MVCRTSGPILNTKKERQNYLDCNLPSSMLFEWEECLICRMIFYFFLSFVLFSNVVLHCLDHLSLWIIGQICFQLNLVSNIETLKKSSVQRRKFRVLILLNAAVYLTKTKDARHWILTLQILHILLKICLF